MENSDAGSSTDRILDIERLRGYAILAVLVMHLDLTGHLTGHFMARCGLNVRYTPFWLGVQLFFVISGFVVLRSFASSGGSLWQFYLRRIFRLWPTRLASFVCWSPSRIPSRHSIRIPGPN